MTHRYTVIGQPIAHSLSPDIHALFAALTQRDIDYTRTEASPETFVSVVEQWQADGACGCNITSPFKEQAAEICDVLSDEAKRAGSVNTIHMHADGRRLGYTTDGTGLVRDITINHQHAVENANVVLLGAGGAARGVMQALLAQNPASLHVVNRTAAKAIALAELFNDSGPVTGDGFDSLEAYLSTIGGAADLIINATTTGHQGKAIELPDQMLGSGTLVYDMAYAEQATPIMRWALGTEGTRQGVRAVNGLGMLVEQAAEAFAVWEGVRPDTRLVYPQLNDIIRRRHA